MLKEILVALTHPLKNGLNVPHVRVKKGSILPIVGAYLLTASMLFESTSEFSIPKSV